MNSLLKVDKEPGMSTYKKKIAFLFYCDVFKALGHFGSHINTFFFFLVQFM